MYFLSYNNKYSNKGSIIQNNSSLYVYLVTVGYLIDISRNFKIKPSVFIKYNHNYQQQADLNVNFIFLDNRLSVGGGYRMNDKSSNLFEAISGVVEVQLKPQLRLGYAYDYSGSNELYKCLMGIIVYPGTYIWYHV